MSVTSDVVARFERTLRGLAHKDQTKIGIAVSGGGDSIALMHLAAQCIASDHLHVFTIDHGLRSEAAQEIALVAAQADALGLDHTTARWQWDGSGNLQAAARAGRWAALVDLAHQHAASTIWMGHTEDDQIETAMMRLARGSGVDGLTGMPQSAKRDGLILQRPLLHHTRAELRDWLAQNGTRWCDDPSNEDTKFDRIRARQMMTQLADLGLTRKRVLQTVGHMQAAKRSLDKAARVFADTHVTQSGGDLIVDMAAIDLTVEDVPRRVIAAALGWVSGQSYRPRFDQMLQLVAKAMGGETTTLHGCVLSSDKDGRLRITREAAATSRLAVDEKLAPPVWDGKWEIGGPIAAGFHVSALGDGIKDCPTWRTTNMPRRSLMASPAIWQGTTLIAAPVAGFAQGWSARIVANFHSSAFAIED